MLGAVEDVTDIFAILRAAERAEELLAHDLREADDGVERGAQLVADIGEEVRFRAAGDLGRLLRGEQRLLAGLQIGDVGADAHHRAVGGPVVADLDPAAVAQLQLERRARLLAQLEAIGKPCLAFAVRHHDLTGIDQGANEVGEMRSGNDAVGDACEGHAELAVAEYEAIVGIEQGEAFGNALERLGQLGLRLDGALGGLGLLGDVAGGAAEAEEVAGQRGEDRQGGYLEEAPRAVAMRHGDGVEREIDGLALRHGKAGEVEKGAADQLERLKAEDIADARGDEGQRKRGVGFPHPIGGKPRDVVEALLGDVQLVTRGGQIGDIVKVAADGTQATIGVIEAGVVGAPMDVLLRRR